MKKNLTLISLMLSVMLLIAVSGVVSAVVSDNNCILCPENPRPCEDVDLCTWTTDTGHQDCGLPLGSGYYAGCPLLDNHNTYWPTGSQGNPSLATATCVFDGTNLEYAMLYLSIDNDIINCTLNGVEVVNFTGHEGCAPLDPRVGGFSEDIYSEVQPGNNTLICTVQDRGVMSHFDACVVGEYEPEPCSLIITDPYAGQWFNSEAVPVNWELNDNNACTPRDDFWLYYMKDGDCSDLDSDDWVDLTSGSPGTFGTFPSYSYLWDKPGDFGSGQYCVKVKLTSHGVRNVSGKFNVDLAPPVVSLSVGTPQVGECLEGETGDCYINQDTEITLTCHDDNPVAPWQSGPGKIEYRYRVDGGSWISWTSYSGAFSFPQDSNHELEYRCFDNVGKVSEQKVKEFIVDTQAPNIDRTVGEPKYCPDYECDWYVNTNTDICVFASDPPPHPVGMGELWCEYWWGNDPHSLTNHYGPFQLEDGECFNYQQDSYHRLDCWAIDRLGNRKDIFWEDIVDTQAPITTLGFIGPYYTYRGSQWINSVSLITLSAVDPEPHPVGVDKIYYRYGIVDNAFCYGTYGCDSYYLSGDFVEYTDPFGLPESCHAIEYYSVDKLGNTEIITTDFVFSDHTAPETEKIVGKPSVAVDYNPIWNWYEHPGIKVEWEVTLNTPITIKCNDVGDHPSGIKEIRWRIVWDGKYNDESASWQYVYDDEVTFYFNKESEHLLEFYCVDNVDKISETDSELFKVTGTSFELEIGDKWDLISVPFNLIGGGNIDGLFGENVVKIWSYENGEWKFYSSTGPSNLHNIVPGRGYWVKTTDASTVLLGGSLFAPGPSLPASVKLDKGWNLIGHYGTASKPAYCSLFSLVDTQQGFPRWSSLWSYNSASQQFIGLNSGDYMNPGRGYWLEIDVEDYYSPSSICWGFPPMIVA